MSVRQRKWTDKAGKVQTAWVVDVVFSLPNGSEKRVTKTSPVNTKAGALEFERQLRGELLAGNYKKEQTKCPTLAEFEPRFMEHASTNNKPSQQKAKRDILRKHLIPRWGSTPLDRITLAEIESFKAAKKNEDLSPKTVNNLLTVLNKLLGLAVKYEVLTVRPEIEWMDALLPDIDFLAFGEEERLLSGFTDATWRNMATLALNTGMRLGELCALRWENIDLVAGRVRVLKNMYRGHEGTPKSGKPREIPLNQKATEALKDQRKRVVGPEQVFLNDWKKPITTYNPPTDAIARACRKAGMRLVGWHTLRHTFASHLAMKGIPIKTIQELLGHASLDMTLRYAHLSPDVRKDAVAVLDTQHPRNTNLEKKKAPDFSGA